MKYLKLFESTIYDLIGKEVSSLIPESFLFEGGNVFKAPDWSKENPNMLTTRILKSNVNSTIDYLEKLTGMSLKSSVMGSTGIAPSSGDIDIAIDMNNVDKNKLIQQMLKKGVISDDIKKTGDSVHYKSPIMGSQKGQYVQVDFMFVPDVEFAVWSATVTPGSAYKGMYKQQLMADLTRTVNPNWKWNHFRGVLDRTTNKSVFGFNPDNIAKALIGPGSSRKDLESVENILSALTAAKHEKATDVKNAYRQTLSRDPKGPRIPDEVTEDVKPKVGRKYQHIEDLVLSHGSQGALHALERMENMFTQGGTIELKWDGMPVVYWGRDKDGTFRMIPKNAWAYLKSGKQQTSSGVTTVMSSPTDVINFIKGTGSGDPESRTEFATMFAKLWSYFEKISPKSGYIEGGLLFYPGKRFDGESAMPKYNSTSKTWDFKPNITTFHVPVDSELGKKIGSIQNGQPKFNSYLMVAATGYYPELGSSDEQRLPNAENLSVPGIIVQGTTYVQEPPKITTNRITKFNSTVVSRAADIDRYLSPKSGLSNPAADIYTYLNQHLRTENLVKDFPDWVKSNLSVKKQQHLLSDTKGMNATLQTIEDLTKLKMQIIDILRSGLHGGIKQTDPEGYAQAHPGASFKYDIPGQFIKMIDQQGWKPRKLDESLNRTGKSDSAVVGWGRGMGHKGHMYLASAVITKAKDLNADPYFILSRTVGKDDPLTPDEKLSIYRKVFPDNKNIFQIATDQLPTLTALLQDLFNNGYKNAVVVVGGDQKQAFQFLSKPTKSTGKLPIPFDHIEVISRQEVTNDPHHNEDGPRATPMRQVLTDPETFKQRHPDKYKDMSNYEMQFNKWRQDMPEALSDAEVKHLMHIAADRMGVTLSDDISEGDNPNYFGNSSQSAIPGTPDSLLPQPSAREIEQYQKELKSLKKFLGR